jgi:hypothetical protein
MCRAPWCALDQAQQLLRCEQHCPETSKLQDGQLDQLQTSYLRKMRRKTHYTENEEMKMGDENFRKVAKEVAEKMV